MESRVYFLLNQLLLENISIYIYIGIVVFFIDFICE